MSELIKKSNENFNASQELITKHKLFASSVHCSYYSCVQLMLEVLKNNLGIQDPLDQAHQDKIGSHVFAINKIFTDLKPGDWEAARNFQMKIEDLKKRRVNSDYTEIKILEQHGKDAHQQAKAVRELLIKNYKLQVNEA